MAEYRPIDLADDRALWDQQPDESTRLYGWFVMYRDIGRARTLAKVADILTKSPEYIRQLSRRYQWTARAGGWDGYQDELWSLEVEQARRDMAREHVQIANDMLDKVKDRIGTLRLDEMEASDIARWVDIAVKVKRTAYGQPEATVAVSGPDGGPVVLDMTKMNVQQRRERLAELRAELDRRIPARTMA